MRRSKLLVVPVAVLCAGACSNDDAISTTSTTASTTTPPSVASTTSTTSPAPDITVTVADGSATDSIRDRVVPYRAYLPDGAVGDVPVVFVSHGGDGSAIGYRTAPHLGTAYAEAGFLAIHVGHLPSAPGVHRADRPADVSFLLDLLETGDLDLPGDWVTRADTSRVGHVGHSFGAFTAHALAGATYRGLGDVADPRIDAIVALSPQGAEQFGAFDDGPGNTTWSSVEVPAYTLIGELEMNDNALGTTYPDGWRLMPFRNYPGTSDTMATVIAGQVHSDLWRTGSGEVQAFIAEQSAQFLRAYVADDTAVDACSIGDGPSELVATERRAGTTSSLLGDCLG